VAAVVVFQPIVDYYTNQGSGLMDRSVDCIHINSALANIGD